MNKNIVQFKRVGALVLITIALSLLYGCFLNSADENTSPSAIKKSRDNEDRPNTDETSKLLSMNDGFKNVEVQWEFVDSSVVAIDMIWYLKIMRYNYENDMHGPAVSILTLKNRFNEDLWADTLSSIYTEDISHYYVNDYLVIECYISTISYRQYYIFVPNKGLILRTKEYDTGLILNRLLNSNDTITLEFLDIGDNAVFVDSEFEIVFDYQLFR